jgi:hypothetical protein
MLRKMAWASTWFVVGFIVVFAFTNGHATAQGADVFLPVIIKGPGGNFAGGPTIGALSDNLSGYPNNKVPRYEKLELTFQLETVASNLYWPFDDLAPAGITPGAGVTVNALFTPDNWKTVYSQPAFYYQDFQHQTKSGRDWIYPTNNFFWKARFSPHQVGTWQYKITAKDAAGIAESATGTFEVTSSQNHGFIQVSQQDPRYFEYNDGRYFTGLGYNLNYRNLDWVSPVLANQDNFQTMSANGIKLVRTWLTHWSIFGSAWSPWKSHNPAHQTQEPDSRLRHDATRPFYLSPGDPGAIAVPESEVFLWLANDETVFGDGYQWDFAPCMTIGWESPSLPVKQNTNYRIRVRFKEQNLSGPKVSGQPFGFTVKIGGWLWDDNDETRRCYHPNAGTVLAASYSDTANWSHYPDPEHSGWEILEGNFNSGASDFISQLYLAIENASSGNVFVDYVWLEEDFGTGQFGPNLFYKPWMSFHQYIDQRNAFAFDEALSLAEQYEVFLKLVVMEKQDYVLNIHEFDGSLSPYLPGENPQLLFYGNGRESTGKTKVRWLEEAWWQYLQARWGYSPNIHSWELLNEGPPGDVRHSILADEFGKYMHCRAFDQPVNGDCTYDHPNDHMITTSFWGGFPYDFLNNTSGQYPDIDYADEHLYASQSSDFDAAQFSYDLSMLRGAYKMSDGTQNPNSVGKPVMRGETGWLASSTDHFAQNDSNGLWLHNLIWAGLNPGGVIESYWVGGPTQPHIYRSGSHDHRSMFKTFDNFIGNIPLNNGNYRDAAPAVSTGNLRAWGQKDLSNECAHLWIQNKNNTWKNVVDGVSIQPVSGTVSVSGFQPGQNYTLQRWDTFQPDPAQQIIQTNVVAADGSGAISIGINNLQSDIAIKIISSGGC